MANSISTTWSIIKTKATDNAWTKYYIDRDGDYIIIVGNATTFYYTKVVGASLTDFENNHKSSATEVKSFNEGVGEVT